VIAAENRHALVVAARALDRVVRHVRHWIPHWYKPAHWVAYRDVYSRPGTKPRYARGVEDTWWHDRAKAAKLERAG